VRGFATTLIIGIVASLFTSIVVTRRSPPTSSTARRQRSRSDDADHQAQDEHRLHRKRKPALFISSVLNLAILVGIAIFGFNFGVDFAGARWWSSSSTTRSAPTRSGPGREGGPARRERAGDRQLQREQLPAPAGGVTQLTPRARSRKQALEALGGISNFHADVQNGIINFRSAQKLTRTGAAGGHGSGTGVKEVRDLGPGAGGGQDYQAVASGMADRITSAMAAGLPSPTSGAAGGLRRPAGR
jgi:preprotein translocase subunit SecF